MLLMIDNYDSFTYNLVQYFGELGEDVRVYRNDEITVEQVAALKPDSTDMVAVQRGDRAVELKVLVAQRPPAQRGER